MKLCESCGWSCWYHSAVFSQDACNVQLYVGGARWKGNDDAQHPTRLHQPSDCPGLHLCITRSLPPMHAAPMLPAPAPAWPYPAQLTWSQQQRVDADAPTHLQLPTGSTVAIDYGGAQPKARVKLQEVFGLADTPLLGGPAVRVPLVLELLSPAGRPLQVALVVRAHQQPPGVFGVWGVFLVCLRLLLA